MPLPEVLRREVDEAVDKLRRHVSRMRLRGWKLVEVSIYVDCYVAAFGQWPLSIREVPEAHVELDVTYGRLDPFEGWKEVTYEIWDTYITPDVLGTSKARKIYLAGLELAKVLAKRVAEHYPDVDMYVEVDCRHIGIDRQWRGRAAEVAEKLEKEAKPVLTLRYTSIHVHTREEEPSLVTAAIAACTGLGLLLMAIGIRKARR